MVTTCPAHYDLSAAQGSWLSNVLSSFIGVRSNRAEDRDPVCWRKRRQTGWDIIVVYRRRSRNRIGLHQIAQQLRTLLRDYRH